MWALVKGERKPPELAGKENRKGEIKDAARMRARVPVYIELEIAYRGIAEAACVVGTPSRRRTRICVRLSSSN